MSATRDEAVRQQALSAGESFIVQAPAGSGKTELLIQRYLVLLGRVGEPEEIVAITFTRKAAGEMRERIVDALRRTAAGHVGREPVEARRLKLARQAMDNDHRHGWELVHHPARLQIHTIDALCLALTRQLPFLSGFAAPSGILENAGAAYRRAAVETIKLLGGPDAQWREALERFLVHLDNDMASATALLADMLASRDQWLRHIGEGGMASEGTDIAWGNVVAGVLQRAYERFPGNLRVSMVDCANAAAGRLAGEGQAARSARAWLAGDGFPAPAVDELPRWRFLADLLVIQSAAQWRKQVNKTLGFQPRSQAKQSMEKLLDALADDFELAEIFYLVRSLPEPRFDPEQAGILDALATVLKLAVAQLQLVFEETTQVDFVEVTQRALAALGALDDPSDLALKLDYHIQHLLVDEFQDTSIAQYRLLRLLTQGWAPGDAKTLFLVGDPMQSIYRFREAEVGVFLRVWEDGLGTIPVTPLRLESNFRSSTRIVKWVNDAFDACFPVSSDLQAGAVAYAPSRPQRALPDEGGGVYVHPFVDSPSAVQADYLAGLVGAALERTVDVAVLVRARSHLEEILPALRSRGIPYSGMDVTALVNEPVVRDLYSLTRALVHPGDRMAWLSLLRAPWCGLSLPDLCAVAGSSRTLIRECLDDPDARTGMSGDGLARIDRFTGAVDGAWRQCGRLTLRQWLRRTWIALDGPAFAGDSGLEHARVYFDLVAEHQSGLSLADERAFHEALQNHWAHSETPTGAVQLMTIHRAKGLEFDEVFLPGLDRPIRSDDKRLLLWEEPVDGEGLLLATLSPRGAPDDAHYEYLRRLQAGKSANETDRLLYVACTRARDRLHLLANLPTREGDLRPPTDDSLLRRIWPVVETRFADPQSVEPSAPAVGSRVTGAGQPLRRVPASWTPPPYPEPLKPVAAPPVDEQRVEFSWAGETVRQVGILVHEVLQQIAEEGLDRWDEPRIRRMAPSWRERLAHIGVPPGELGDAARRAGKAIGNLLADDRAGWLLDRNHEQAANEYELSVLVGERVRRLRIDRTFVDRQGVRWIVDYKTSSHEGGAVEAFLDEEVRRYREQLEFYASAFQGMENREIRLGLYFPLLMGWREWVYGE